MNKIRVGAAAAVAALAAASGSLASPATASHQGSARTAGFVTPLHYTFDYGETLRDGSAVTNVGHPRFPGHVQTAFSGHLTVVAGRFGHGAGFPRPCGSCGRGIIEANDRPALDPGRHRLVFGVAVKVSQYQAQGDSNLVQKGLYDEVGGQYKLQMDDGVPSCVIFGSRGRLVVRARSTVGDGTWHTLRCSRTRARVTLRVDGRIVGRLNGPTGRISNSAPVRVGGLSLIRANDQYHGNLDGVYVRIRR